MPINMMARNHERAGDIRRQTHLDLTHIPAANPEGFMSLSGIRTVGCW